VFLVVFNIPTSHLLVWQQEVVIILAFSIREAKHKHFRLFETQVVSNPTIKQLLITHSSILEIPELLLVFLPAI
jgi:hypothetical protein